MWTFSLLSTSRSKQVLRQFLLRSLLKCSRCSDDCPISTAFMEFVPYTRLKGVSFVDDYAISEFNYFIIPLGC